MTKEAVNKISIKEVETVKQALNSYIEMNVVSDFSSIRSIEKLAYLQKTPEKYILKRKIGSNQISYVSHFYAEKALNFAFNFKWGYEVVEKEIIEYTQKTQNGTKTVYDGSVLLKCYVDFDGTIIKRDIQGTHKCFENPATSKKEATKGAISRAITLLARQFGIGSELDESSNMADIEDTYIDESKNPISNVDDIIKKINSVKSEEELKKVKEVEVMGIFEKLTEEAQGKIIIAMKEKADDLKGQEDFLEKADSARKEKSEQVDKKTGEIIDAEIVEGDTDTPANLKDAFLGKGAGQDSHLNPDGTKKPKANSSSKK